MDLPCRAGYIFERLCHFFTLTRLFNTILFPWGDQAPQYPIYRKLLVYLPYLMLTIFFGNLVKNIQLKRCPQALKRYYIQVKMVFDSTHRTT